MFENAPAPRLPLFAAIVVLTLLAGAATAAPSSAGLRFSSPDRLSGKHVKRAQNPLIATTPRGRSLVAWAFNRGPQRTGFAAAAVKPNGKRERGRRVFKSTVRTTDAFSDLAVDSSGAGTLVWRLPEADKVNVVSLDRKGRSTAHLRLGAGPVLRPEQPRVVRADDGVATVVWKGFEPGPGGGTQRILAARIQPDGSVSGPFALSAGASEQDLTFLSGQGPEAAVAPDGEVTVVWPAVSDGPGGAPAGTAWVARIDSAGNPSAPVRFDTGTAGAGDPRVVDDGDGRSTLLWQGKLEDGRTAIRFRRLDPDGALGPAGTLAAAPALTLRSATADAAGRVNVSWLRIGEPGELRPKRKLQMRRLGAGGALRPAQRIAAGRWIKGGELTAGSRPVITWQTQRRPGTTRPAIVKAIALRGSGTLGRHARPVRLGRGDSRSDAMPRIAAGRSSDPRVVTGRNRGDRNSKALLYEGSL